MTKEELQALLAGVTDPIVKQLGELGTKVSAIETGNTELKANAAMRDKVAAHAKALRDAAAAMEAAGVGLDSNRGHVKVLHHMAACMEAEAAGGKLPHAYNSYDLHHSAAPAAAQALDAKAIETAIAAALKPMQDELAASKTVIEDLKAKGFRETQEPARKTASKDTIALLAKGGIAEVPKEPMNEHQVDKMLEAAGVTSMSGRIAAKLQLSKDGVMARTH